MTWCEVAPNDPNAIDIFSRHYSARSGKVDRWHRYGFVGTGKSMVLLSGDGALFVWKWEVYRRDGREGIQCSVFRNESTALSSVLIGEAVRTAYARWGVQPLMTFVNAAKDDKSLSIVLEPSRVLGDFVNPRVDDKTLTLLLDSTSLIDPEPMGIDWDATSRSIQAIFEPLMRFGERYASMFQGEYVAEDDGTRKRKPNSNKPNKPAIYASTRMKPMQINDRDRVLLGGRWFEVAVWRDDFVELVDMSVPECRFAQGKDEVEALKAQIQGVDFA